ncbi:hypothetical protein PCE1_001178 [Barthelona sp. PCE]
MPRVRKFEDDLIIRAYPEGQLIFEGEGVALINSREITEISLIESAIEDKDFVGYVEDTRKPLQYTSKLKAGESYMIIDMISDDSGIITHLDILLFDHIMSDEHIRRRIPFPLCLTKFLVIDIIPMDENHLLLTIDETVNNRQVILCYILSALTDEYRCLGEYDLIESNINSNYIMLRKCQDDTTWHYNFSVDDMDEAHEPDIEQLHGIYSGYIIIMWCLNSDCICLVSFRDQEIDELIIFDCQRNRVNLTERFPQLKGLNINRYSSFSLLTLTQNVLSMIFIYSRCVVVHIENGELKMSEGKLNFKNVICDGWKHIDLNDNYFHDEDCVFYSVDKITGRCGLIKFRTVDNEVFWLNSLQPNRIFFDGITEVYGHNASIRCYFFFKERKLIVLRGCRKPFSHTSCEIRSVHPNEGDEFFVMAKVRSEVVTTYVKLCWNGSEFKPITTILPHCGSENYGFIQGLPLNVDLENRAGLVYLGEKMILDLPPNFYVLSVHGSHFDNSACIVCIEATHFFQLNVNGYDVEVQKHIIFEHEYLYDVYFNPRPLAETPDHQLFVVCTHSRVATTQHLHCLDWSTGRFLEPVHLYQNNKNEKIEEGHSFRNFVGDSYIQVRGGIIKVYVEDGAIETHFYINDSLPYELNISHDPNLPNNTVQDMSYEEETKTMVLKTYNIEEDPESMNPTVETFHLPSFLAEASIVEYHMPDYHEHYHNE